jgi:heme-degrading monooxygenase HmoA
MILEHAILPVTTGREAEVRRQAEDDSVYLLLVRWSSVAAHQAFRDSDLFDQWRTLTHPLYCDKPEVTHFAEPLER